MKYILVCGGVISGIGKGKKMFDKKNYNISDWLL